MIVCETYLILLAGLPDAEVCGGHLLHVGGFTCVKSHDLSEKSVSKRNVKGSGDFGLLPKELLFRDLEKE